MQVLYEDNHLVIVSKDPGEITQGDKTGDTPLPDLVKDYLKEKYHKPGQVFLGVVHRLDRPVSGVVVFARTSKALSRMNQMFAQKDQADSSLTKTYWAIVANRPPQDEATLIHWLTRDEKTNKARAYDHEVPHSKRAQLHYRLIGQSEHYFLLEIQLQTGRHHQIRAQLAHIGCSIRGDLKYGAPRSLPDGSISLHARRICFEHPVSHQVIDITAPLPKDKLWGAFIEE